MQEQPQKIDELVNIIMDYPGVEIDCSSFPNCKCDDKGTRCVNFLGLAGKILNFTGKATLK